MAGRARARLLLGCALAAAAALAGCTRAHDCRPGTLFLNVHFAPYTGVAHVFVQVMVAGETTRSTTFDVQPAGADGGGVEVDFATYPAGKHANVVVRLDGASGALASRTVDVELSGECAAVDVGFGGTDGGAAGTTGTAGAGGRGGSAGATAGTGGGGTGGGAAGAAGTGGGPAGTGGGAAGTTGNAGTGGGSAGTGGGGAGGTTGSGGAGGRGGGTAGATAGTGGSAGTTGAGGRGGTGSCTPTGAESCFNNFDDDCDGLVDCMDPDCNAVAVCLPSDPIAGQVGVVMPDATTPCPPNYGTATTINRGTLQAGQCTGCSCTPPAVNCVAPFYDYPTYDKCMSDPAGSMSMVGSYSSGLQCSTPGWHQYDVNGYVFGVGLGAMTPMYPGCSASGNPVAGAPTWTTTTRFCATTLMGGGCPTGEVCLPAITSTPKRCVLTASNFTCPAGTTRSDYYTGYTGAVTCNPCSCGQPSGAGCGGVRMYVGSTNTCPAAAQAALLSPGEHICAAPGTLLNPSIVFQGQPTSPTCTPSATSSGTLTPSGPQAVCCH